MGIITIADFLNQVNPTKSSSLSAQLQKFIKKTHDVTTDKHEYAGHLMQTNVFTLREEQHVMDVLNIISQKNIRHFPVVNEQEKVVGMITARNILSVLSKGI